MKFGGTSVEDAAAIRRLIGIVRESIRAASCGTGGARPVVVVSALARVTDQLLEAGNAAAKGHLGSALATVRDIYVRHEQLADSLVDDSAYGALDRELRGEFRALESLLHDLEARVDWISKTQDQSARLRGMFFQPAGEGSSLRGWSRAAHVDARACIVTDARHGQASPVWDVTRSRVQEALSPAAGARASAGAGRVHRGDGETAFRRLWAAEGPISAPRLSALR